MFDPGIGRMDFRAFWPIIFLLIISLHVSAKPRFDGPPKLKVLVGQGLKDVLVAGTDLEKSIGKDGQRKRYEGPKKLKFTCRKLSSKGAGHPPLLLATLQSQTGIISLADKKFRGRLLIATSLEEGAGCDVINEIPLESYISALLAKEMNSNWHLEALKAQAVAARTYALHKMQTKEVSRELGHDVFHDLESSEKHQVGGSFFDTNDNTNMASSATSGEILLTKTGMLTPIFFHAQCGGTTLLPSQVWSDVVEGYQRVKCPFCEGQNTRGDWEKKLSDDQVYKFLLWVIANSYVQGIFKDELQKGTLAIAPDRKDKSKMRIYCGEKLFVLDKSLLRRYFGRVVIPSNNFVINRYAKGIRLVGKGLGHGVGMCQLGALYLAKQGWNYRKILAHYFPGHKIEKVY